MGEREQRTGTKGPHFVGFPFDFPLLSLSFHYLAGYRALTFKEAHCTSNFLRIETHSNLFFILYAKRYSMENLLNVPLQVLARTCSWKVSVFEMKKAQLFLILRFGTCQHGNVVKETGDWLFLCNIISAVRSVALFAMFALFSVKGCQWSNIFWTNSSILTETQKT